MNNVYEHYRSINNEPLYLMIKRTDQKLEINLKLVMRNKFRALIKNILLTSFLIYLINYYFQFSSTLINFFFFFCIVILLFKFFILIVEESLTIEKEPNKTKYSYRYLIGLKRDKTISSNNIIINEGIIYNRVIYYMGVELNEPEEIFPLFCKLLPRLDCLKCIFTSIQNFDKSSEMNSFK